MSESSINPHDQVRYASYCNANGIRIYPELVSDYSVRICIEVRGKPKLSTELYKRLVPGYIKGKKANVWNPEIDEKIRIDYKNIYEQLIKKRQTHETHQPI